MSMNQWIENNPLKKFFNEGNYNLKELKNWRGKFLGCDKNIAEFMISNIKPNGRKSNNLIRKIRRFFYINGQGTFALGSSIGNFL